MTGHQFLLLIVIIISALRIAATAAGEQPSPTQFVMAHLTIIVAAMAAIVRFA